MKLIKITSPVKYRSSVKQILKDRGIKESFKIFGERGDDYYELIIEDKYTEKIIDELEKALHINDYEKKIKEKGTISIVKVESFLPIRKAPKKIFFKSQRISSEEIIQKVQNSTNLNQHYAIFLVLSAIIASIGLLANNPIITIGAVIISPLVGPILGFSLGNVIENKNMLRAGLITTTVGIILAVLVGFLIVKIYPYPEITSEILLRTNANLLDLSLALSAGAVGSLALLFDVGLSVAGVAVAVALLTPAITIGMGLGFGNFDIFFGSLLLFITNLIALVFINMLIFWVSGIKKGEKELTDTKKQQVKKRVKRIVYVIAILSIVLGFLTLTSTQEELKQKQIIKDIENLYPEITVINLQINQNMIVLDLETSIELSKTIQESIKKIVQKNYEQQILITYTKKQALTIV